MTLRLRVGLLHIYDVVVKDGSYEYSVRLKGTRRAAMCDAVIYRKLDSNS